MLNTHYNWHSRFSFLLEKIPLFSRWGWGLQLRDYMCGGCSWYLTHRPPWFSKTTVNISFQVIQSVVKWSTATYLMHATTGNVHNDDNITWNYYEIFIPFQSRHTYVHTYTYAYEWSQILSQKNAWKFM